MDGWYTVSISISISTAERKGTTRSKRQNNVKMLDKKSQVINHTHQLLHQRATIVLTYVDGEFGFAVRIYNLHNIIIKDVLCIRFVFVLLVQIKMDIVLISGHIAYCCYYINKDALLFCVCWGNNQTVLYFIVLGLTFENTEQNRWLWRRERRLHHFCFTCIFIRCWRSFVYKWIFRAHL